ncbi:MAG: tetratricopeptide repeat protein, partial [Deltaproteobacteria bacterium]|nr:tetratricopeptide repeat protein [Deltaproteobacteria bacterium]
MSRSPYPPWELAKLAGSAGDYGKALFYLRKALERYPSSPWIRIDMAKALAGLRRWDEAGDILGEVAKYGQFDQRATDTARKYLDEIRSKSKRL